MDLQANQAASEPPILGFSRIYSMYVHFLTFNMQPRSL